MLIFLLFVYIVLCLGVAFMAYLKTYDMIEYFFLSILVTPFIGFFFLWKTDHLR